MMTCTVARLYDDYPTASEVVRELEAAGIARLEISIIASNLDGWYAEDDTGAGERDATADSAAPAARTTDKSTAAASTRPADRDRHDDQRTEGALLGGALGATVGTGVGLLAGLGLLAIPGLGPVVGAGWLASMAVGAVVGGAAGGIIGALTKAGVSKEDAPVYAEGIRRGGAVVSARAGEPDRQRIEEMLDRSAVNIDERRAEYQKSGWRRFDANAPAYIP